MNQTPMLRSSLIASSFAGLAFAVWAGAASAQAPDLSALHDALHLTAPQEDAWRAYTSAIAPDPEAAARHRAAAMMIPTLPTPRRVDLIDAEMAEDQAVVRRQGEAVKAFYATLTPEQQRAFDRQTAPGQAGQGAGAGGSLRQPQNGALPPPGRP
jgi:hypothetical protein